MEKITTDIPDVFVLKTKVFADERGFFMESFNQRAWYDTTGLEARFVQDNHSLSNCGVLRGLHYQVRHPQGKLVRVIQGEVFDVAVDLRRSSPTFGNWVGEILSSENKRQLWIPEGFAHGFMVLSKTAEVLYKSTDFYAPVFERSIRWDDPTLAIDWPVGVTPILSAKDATAPLFIDAEYFS